MSIPVCIDDRPPLKVYLLGAPEITCAALVPAQQLPTKARAVLFYLALTGSGAVDLALVRIEAGLRCGVLAGLR